MARALGVDLGNVHIGLAVSDTEKRFSRPLLVLKREKGDVETARKLLAAVAREEPIDLIVVGLPLMLNGKEGEMAVGARRFAQVLAEVSKRTVLLWDERLTTAQVERTLKEAGLSRKKRQQHIDTMAASLILQSYLDAHV